MDDIFLEVSCDIDCAGWAFTSDAGYAGALAEVLAALLALTGGGINGWRGVFLLLHRTTVLYRNERFD